MKRQRKDQLEIPVLTWDILEKAHALYLEEEPRDAMYKVSTYLISNFWDNDFEVSSALGVLLLTWNSAFYRYGDIDYLLIQSSISRHKTLIDDFRRRDIWSCSETDKESIREVYRDFLNSLRCKGKKNRKNSGKLSFSPVSVAKALHLLCPTFFPLWDTKIATRYECYWRSNEASFENYWNFINISKEQIINLIKDLKKPSSLEGLGELKLIDEYNYLRFTRGLNII
ncbi:MAG: hypothetical protein ACYDAO_05135 [Thermoplasmataceae archaeon]